MDAEELAASQYASMHEKQDVDKNIRESFRDRMVELYNNMGTTEKTQGSMKRARDLSAKLWRSTQRMVMP